MVLELFDATVFEKDLVDTCDEVWTGPVDVNGASSLREVHAHGVMSAGGTRLHRTFSTSAHESTSTRCTWVARTPQNGPNPASATAQRALLAQGQRTSLLPATTTSMARGCRRVGAMPRCNLRPSWSQDLSVSTRAPEPGHGGPGGCAGTWRERRQRFPHLPGRQADHFDNRRRPVRRPGIVSRQLPLHRQSDPER